MLALRWVAPCLHCSATATARPAATTRTCRRRLTDLPQAVTSISRKLATKAPLKAKDRARIIVSFRYEFTCMFGIAGTLALCSFACADN